MMKKCMMIAAMLLSLSACDRKPQAEEYPMFWTWLSYRPQMNVDSVFTVIRETGIDGVMLNAPSPEVFREVAPIAKKHGITLYAWLVTMNLEHGDRAIVQEHPEWLSVNRSGKSLADTTAYVDYYRFLCPALPEVREFLVEKARRYCEVEGVEGISIDYHRFVDVVLPTSLWSKYDVVQDREYAAWDYGYHPYMIEKFKAEYGYDPREQEDPSKDLIWRQFRCDQVTEAANLIADEVHAHGKKMAASPFPTPKMSARMVRQDWGKWDLDIVFPMVYTGFYTFDPSFAYDCTVENVRDKNPKTTLYCGLGVGWEASVDSIFPNMDEAFRGGAQGISIFTIDGLRSPEIRARFRAYTDSLKAVKASNGGVMPLKDIPAAADPDPFHHAGLLEKISGKVSEMAGRDVTLTDYRLVGEHDVTKEYEALDPVSGAKYLVTFYFYGDVISGWDVKALQPSF